MDTKYLKQVEEKYVFNMSLIFWRFLVSIAGLALVGGLLFVLWGVIPAFKSSVKKDKYPPVVTVSLTELQEKVLPAEQKPKVVAQVASKEPIKVAEEKEESEQPEVTREETEYRALLDSLKALIPPEKYTWKSRGHWEYPYGKDYWEYYRTSRYRRWQVDRLGIKDRLKYTYEKVGANDYLSQKTLLDAYLSVLARFSEEQRTDALHALAAYSKESVAQAVANIQLLSESIANFSTERVDYLKKLATFGSKNPNDGARFIEYANKTLGTFDSTVRLNALQVMISTYYNHFNNRIAVQTEITDMFLPMVKDFDAEHQVPALENYYQLYLRKNASRMAAIEQIDYDYERALSRAASEHRARQSNKAEWRLRGFYAIGGAVIFIAIVALILVFLSMQRYLEKICASLETK